MVSVLEDAGIDLDKLQEIPLETDPEEQALERAKQEMVHAAVQRFMDLHAYARRFAPVLVQCGFCDEYFPQTKTLYKVIRCLDIGIIATSGSNACEVDYRRPIKEWVELAKARSKGKR